MASELGAFWTPLDWIIVDARLCLVPFSLHRVATPPETTFPGAVETVVAVGVAVTREIGWHGGARLRYFGPAPLIEDGSVASDPTTLVNADVGYRFANAERAALTVFNLFDADDNDITYFYESQLPGEASPSRTSFPSRRATHVPAHAWVKLLRCATHSQHDTHRPTLSPVAPERALRRTRDRLRHRRPDHRRTAVRDRLARRRARAALHRGRRHPQLRARGLRVGRGRPLPRRHGQRRRPCAG